MDNETTQADKIAALRHDGFEAMRMRGVRARQGLLVMLVAFGLGAASIYLEVPPLLWAAWIVCIGGIFVRIDGYRFMKRASLIDVQVRQLDPNARFLSSLPEEIGLGIRARMDEQRAQNGS